MQSTIKIGTAVFGGGESTLGMAIVEDCIKDHMQDRAHIRRNVDANQAKGVDILLVSLYWWKDIYALVRFLALAGIDPRTRRPIIIIGGMSAINPFVLDGYYHYAIIGDGEEAAPALVDAIARGEEEVDLPGIIVPGQTEGQFAQPAELRVQHYVETRTNKTTRVEIARGCRFSCPFCELAAIKPYRELPYEIIRHLIVTSPTKNIALFAPDRASHSRYLDIERCITKIGKRNTGSDVRLDMVKLQNVASTLRFGIEAFTAKVRRKVKGMKSNDELVEYFRYIFDEIKTPKGKPISTATAYMIADLPGERGLDAIEEFSDTLKRIDEQCRRKFTLFLSVAGFMPAPYTRMERAACDPYSRFNELWDKHKYRTKNITIASRGAVISPTMRIAQMLTVRGDERARKIIYFLAVDPRGRKLLKDRSVKAGKALENIISTYTDLDSDFLYRELTESEQLPSNRIALTKLQ